MRKGRSVSLNRQLSILDKKHNKIVGPNMSILYMRKMRLRKKSRLLRIKCEHKSGLESCPFNVTSLYSRDFTKEEANDDVEIRPLLG